MPGSSVHFVAYGSYDAPCGYTYEPGDKQAAYTDTWQHVTCTRCLDRGPHHFELWEEEFKRG